MLVIVRNSLVAAVASLVLLALPLIFPDTAEPIWHTTMCILLLPAVGAAVGFALVAISAVPHPSQSVDEVMVGALGVALAALVAVLPLLTFVSAVEHDLTRMLAFGAYVIGGVAFFSWLYETRAERAVKRAERESEEASREALSAQLDDIEAALHNVSDDWLTDALDAPENTDRENLVALVATLPDGIEHALKRAHRKGVKADDVAPLIASGSFTEADADRLAREVA